MREYVPNYIEVANREELSLTEALLELTRQEAIHQQKQKMNRVVTRARFPKRTSLEEFDFSFQPSINKREILDLKHMGFVEKHENLVFIGDYCQRNVPALPSFVPPFAMKCTSHCQTVYHLLTSV